MRPYKEYLIITPNPEYYENDELGLRAVIRSQEYENEQVLMITALDNPIQPGDRLVFGCAAYTREMVEPLDEVLYEALRPLGNNPDGTATKYLGYPTWAGVGPRKLGDIESPDYMAQIYPGTPPFEITFKRKYFEDGVYSGEGWRAEATAGTSRNGTEYFVAIYNDPACAVNNFLFNTPFMSLEDSEWQFDGEGNPLQVYATEYNMAHQGQPERAVIYHGLCKGSIHIQEGYGTLTLQEDEDVYQFWDKTQEATGAEFVDSGIEVTGILGAGVYSVSSSDGFIAGETLQIDEQETTFTRVHSPGIIVVSTHIASAVGKNIFWMR